MEPLRVSLNREQVRRITMLLNDDIVRIQTARQERGEPIDVETMRELHPELMGLMTVFLDLTSLGKK